MGYVGCATLDQLRSRCEFIQVTASGQRESHVHDVIIVQEAPNYRVD
jgi:IMP dehydrogenase